MLIAFWVLCGIAAGMIGSAKGEGGTGFLLGLLLGPFGVLFAALSTGNRKTCAFCKEKIHRDATVCPKCQREQVASAATPATTTTVRCAECGTVYDANRNHCPACYSAEVATPMFWTCANCGQSNERGTTRCLLCLRKHVTP